MKVARSRRSYGPIATGRKILVTICHLQDHCHHGNVTHNDLKACLEFVELVLAHQKVLTQRKLRCWDVDLALIDCCLAAWRLLYE